VPSEQLKTYEEALAQYHLHPEAKFHNGNYLDSGVTLRRHILATAAEHIGKEANRWEEQLYLGLDLDAQTDYGPEPDDHERIFAAVRLMGKKFGQRKLAEAACTSLSEVSTILRGKRRPTLATLTKLYRALSRLERVALAEAELTREVLEAVKRRCRLIGVRWLAKRAGVDAANLAKALSGRREPSRAMLAKLEAALRLRT
jgi:transcriptional regulator with XRE-family HTH domain